jgi:tRNA A-37 threonylcarbamoyl transferase component Bud32
MMAPPEYRTRSAPRPEASQISIFQQILRDIRRIMAKEFGLARVSIRPIGSDGSRLSMPVRITGINPERKTVRYFGKILGPNDVVSDRSMQFAKNLYLHMSALDPIFGFTDTAEDMARQQFESLRAIYASGIPTAKPLGYYRLNEGTWLLVAEYLRARPLSEQTKGTVDLIDTLFAYLKRLHSRGLVHGDIKPENILLGDQVYVLDTGVFRAGVAFSRKRAYDLACLICTFLEGHSVREVLRHAERYYSRQNIEDALGYVDLVQQRQDFHFTNAQKDQLKRLMRDPSAAVPAPRRA